MFRHQAYFIETLTNTHVGSGDTGYSFADNVIQKDPITMIPVFHASSIKGSVRDHFEQYKAEKNFQPKDSKEIKPFTFNAIFGGEEAEDYKTLEESLNKSDLTEEQKNKLKKEIGLLKNAPKHGLVKFHEARLLTLPLRSSALVYHNGTSPAVVIDYLETLKQLKVENANSKENNANSEFKEIDDLLEFFRTIETELNKSNSHFAVFTNQKNLIIEDYENGFSKNITDDKKNLISKYLSPRNSENFINSLAIFKDKTFQEICEHGLPIIARNKLEKGESKNLFYEEVLPRRAVLWFITGTYHKFYEKEENAFQKMFEFYEKKLVSDNIQMGANASVGYGVTCITRLGGNES